MSMAKVTITENAADFIIKYMAKAKKPKKKEYSRAEFLKGGAMVMIIFVLTELAILAGAIFALMKIKENFMKELRKNG